MTLVMLLKGPAFKIFFITALTTLTFWHSGPGVISAAAFVGIVASVAAGVREVDGDRWVRDPGLTTTGCVGVVSGVVTGAYAHETFLAPFFAIALGREYRDVLASKGAAAYADAGKIHFGSHSLVDTTRSVGYQDGRTYCAAPVIDAGDAQTRTIGFWAVGFDCCNARGDFECGAAGDFGSTGGVVLAPDGWLERSRRDFLLAVNQSAAVNNLVVERNPILIRWVKDPGGEQTALFFSALGVLALGGLLFVVFILAALCIEMTTYPQEEAAQGQGLPK